MRKKGKRKTHHYYWKMTAKLMAQLCGVNPRTINRWAKAGLFKPTEPLDCIRVINSKHKETLHVIQLPELQEACSSEHSAGSSSH